MTISEKQNDSSPSADIVIGRPTEFIVLACKSNALRCRVPGTPRELTLRTAIGNEVPRRSRFATWASGGEWDPAEEYWGEEDKPLDE